MKDARLGLGLLFIICYYATLWVIGFREMPEANVGLIKDALLQLGPPVGVIVGALFRTDSNDERRTENTRAAFDAITAAANSTPMPQPVQVVNDADQPVPVKPEVQE